MEQVVYFAWINFFVVAKKWCVVKYEAEGRGG